MGTSGSASDPTREEIRSVFSQISEPCTPLSASEVAAKLDCPERVARRHLEGLTERGELQSRRVDDERQVWWTTSEPESASEGPDLREFGEFVRAVEDYGIFTLDPDGTVASWNEGAGRIKGYATDDILGAHFSTFYTEADVDAGVPTRNLETAAAEGHAEDEGWRVREDGSQFWANVVITAIRDADGTLQGFTKVTRDMTERREFEQQLRQERDLTRQILETVPISVGVLAPDGRFVRANPHMLDRHEIDESDLDEFSLTALDVYDADGEPIEEDDWPWRRVVETGEPVHDFQSQIDVPDGGRQWISVNAAPLAESAESGDRVVVAVDDITEQKVRERQLRREYRQTEKLLRTAPIAVAVQNADGDTVMANQRAQEALGLSEQEFIEKPDDLDEWDIYDAEGDPLTPEEIPAARVLATGEPVRNEEIVIESPSGERLQFHINAAPLFGSDGQVERVITTGEDITELKKREQQLERRKSELETELSEILGRISDAFYALDDELRFTHLNEQAAEILQQSRDDLLGRRLWDVFPNPADVYRENFRRAMETQEPLTFEEYTDEIGTWLEFNVYPSESGLSIYFRDVTERKERERTLAKYETIVETVDDGIYVKDSDGHFTMVNEAYAELTGYEKSDLVGAHASLVVDEATIERATETKAASDDDESNPTMEAMVRTASGDTVPAEGTFATIETDDGETEQVGVVRDITRRKEYERQLEQSNERLEQFAYAASHDLQEPLRMVSSYLQLIERRYADDLDDDGEEFIEFAVDGADRMRDMIEGLLEYSRVQTQGDPFEELDLESVLSDARDDLKLQIEGSDAEITAEPLPTVRGDPRQLRQVFQNLLDNAIEYSGDEPPRVDITTERDGAYWRVAVRDDGIGIDPEDADRIFEVFQRLHNQDEHAGTGIGLALCRRIVERHGGEIWVDSEPGEGATFTFTLPVEGETDE